MLHPNQFRINEAWIAFKLNNAPIHTEIHGDFYCMALMDAASCFILTMEMVPVTTAELSKLDAKRLLKKGRAHKQELPQSLFIPTDQPANNLALEAKRQNVTVVRVPEDQLLLFIGEARDGFKKRFGGGDLQ